MKFNVCILAAICLLFAGCNKSEQTKSDDSQPQSGSGPAGTGQFGPGPNPGGGFGDPGGVGGSGGTAGGGNFDPAARFRASDTDSDGKLTGEEISDRMKKNLEAIDADKDGAITLEEQQEWFRKRSAEGGFGGGPGGTGGGPGGFGGGPGGFGGGGDFRGAGPGGDRRNSEEYKSGKHRPEADE